MPRQKPSSGITGEDCSQPPDGVAEIMLPAWSMMSKCTVSPRDFAEAADRRLAGAHGADRFAARLPGARSFDHGAETLDRAGPNSSEALSEISLRRSSL